MTERVQKLLAAAGLCSRRTAEEWIAAGRVTVNGRAAHIGDKADPETDTVAVDGRPIGCAAGHVYIMLYKPRGYVTTLSDERGRRTAAELVKDCGVRVYPVGLPCCGSSIIQKPPPHWMRTVCRSRGRT